MFANREEIFLRFEGPDCEIDLDSLSMTDGLRHILEHKKKRQK